MVDQFDRAQELDAYYRREAMANHQDRTRITTPSRINCIDCGEVIPELRRKLVAGCIRCVSCQELFDQESNAWRR